MFQKNPNIFRLHRFNKDFELSPHFQTSEFRCNHCNRLTLDIRLVKALEKLRVIVDKPLVINSGYRCPEYNKKVGGVRNSRHTKGLAVDVITPKGMSTKGFAELIWDTKEQTGIKRVGCYDGYKGKYGFVHLSIKKHLFAPDRFGDW